MTSAAGQPEKAPTMADVAARAQVSRALVSTVFRDVPGASPSTKKRVLQAAAELGYRLDNRARMLRRSRTKQLGVVFQVQDAFHNDLVEALYDVADRTEYRLLLGASTPTRHEMSAVDVLLDDRCEALLLVSPQMSKRELSELAVRAPVVVMGRRIKHPKIDTVRTDDRDVVETALNHLTALGHRRIAHLDGARIFGSADRRRSYQAGMRARGLEAFIRIVPGGNSENEGMRAASQLLLGSDLPSAVTTFNDRSAIGLMFGLRAAGVRVPEDVSIVGYDDVRMAELPFIALSTVGQNAVATAQAAIDRIIGRLDEAQPAGEETLVAPYFTTRTTTARAGDAVAAWSVPEPRPAAASSENELLKASGV